MEATQGGEEGRGRGAGTFETMVWTPEPHSTNLGESFNPLDLQFFHLQSGDTNSTYLGVPEGTE